MYLKNVKRLTAGILLSAMVVTASPNTASAEDLSNGIAAGKAVSIKADQTEKGKRLVKYAKKFVGNPYRYGGTSLTKGTDCSGFTRALYKHFGYNLPHSSTAQRHVGKKVSWKSKKAGDIICYNGHVAIYIGGGKIIHAATERTGIRIGKKANFQHVVCVRRVFK